MTPGVLHRWRRYPKYKPSGVEWLGEVPEGWKVSKLKRIARFAYGDSLAEEDRSDGEIQVFGSNGVIGNHNLQNTKSPCIIIGRKGSFGKINYSEMPCFAIDTTFFIDSSISQHNLRWLFYCLNWAKLDKVSKDSAVPGLSREDAYDNLIPFGSVSDQSAIAAFLDRETTRIDALIAKKERQIELLTEKRAALISHTVTKGLDPTVPMKGPGVEWISEVPEHYRVLPIKRFIKIRYGLGEPPKELETGLPIVRATNIDQGKIIDEGMMFVDPKDVPASRDAFLRENEIIIVRSGANTGDSTIIPKKYAGSLSGYDMVVTVKDGVPGYFAWQFLTSEVRDLQFGFCKLRAAQPHLNAEELGNTLFVIPPNDEQKSISTYIRQNTDRIDCIHQKIVVSINKLREYRSALISSAVTGKIDVRQEAKA